MTMIVYFLNNIQNKFRSSEKDTSYWCPPVIGHRRGFASSGSTSLGGTQFFFGRSFAEIRKAGHFGWK